MHIQVIHQRLYIANATVLVTHQIDAAYWHEWQLFGLPGGIQLFLLLNLPIVLVVLWGTLALGAARPAGVVISWLLVASGLFAVIFHGVYLLRGNEGFSLPVSLALLAATLVLSLAQMSSLIALKRHLALSSCEPAAAP